MAIAVVHMNCWSCASKMFALLCFLSLIYVSSAQTSVKTSVGPVTGTQVTGTILTNVTYVAYKNIPYAQAPTSSLRFKATHLYNTTSTNTVNSKSNSTIACPQLGVPTGVTTDEDCLYLNVYTPLDASTNKTYPVMVWIHGGFFIYGYGAMYNPELLIKQNVIVVTINYRLGALGFLSLGNEDAPGNAGLKDQIIALEWVKKEISNFGGDTNKTTLFGQDAGSASVHHHILSALSKGTFNRAIMESGALEEWCYLETGFTDRARTFAQQLGCLNNNNVNFSCLAQANVASILSAQALPLSDEDVFRASLVPFPPVKEVIAENAFQQETFQNLMTNPVANPVSAIIMGINKDEGLFGMRQNDNFYNSFFDNLVYFIPQSVRSQLTTEEKNTRVNNLKKAYFSDDIRPSITNNKGYIKLYTDKVFAYPTYAAAQTLTKTGSSDVYLYQFEYDGLFKNPNSDAALLQIAGVGHGDELGYLFYLGYSNQKSTNTDAFNIMTKMTKLWSFFATNGNPNPTTTDQTLNVPWTKISNSSEAYFSINTNLAMSSTNTSIISQEAIGIWTALAAAHSASIYLQPTTAMVIIAALIAKYCSL